MTYSPGDVVLVRFPFTDFSSGKKRPAVVINPNEYQARFNDIVLLAVTTKPQPESSLALTDWEQAGLPRASYLKPVIGTFSSDIVLKQIGQLVSTDWHRIQAALHMSIAGDLLKPG